MTLPRARSSSPTKGTTAVSTTSVTVISDATNVGYDGRQHGGQQHSVLAYDSAKGEIFVGGGRRLHRRCNLRQCRRHEHVGFHRVSTSQSHLRRALRPRSASAPARSVHQLSVSCTTFTYNTSTAQGGPGTIGVSLDPIGLAYDSGTGEVFVAEFSAPAVSAISDSTNSVVATVEVPGLNNPGFHESPSPQYIAYDSGQGRALRIQSLRQLPHGHLRRDQHGRNDH